MTSREGTMFGRMCLMLDSKAGTSRYNRPGYEVLLFQGQGLATHLPSEPGPQQETDNDNDVLQRWLGDGSHHHRD